MTGINERYGLLNEQRVLKELQRRRLPFQHSVQVGSFEVDFIVGKRIAVEVDGYVHVLKETLAKDAAKDEHLRALGYSILRVTSSEVKHKGLLKAFGAKVQRAYEEELVSLKRAEGAPFRGEVPTDELVKLKHTLEQAKAQEQTKQQLLEKVKPLSDEELFLAEIARLDKTRK